MRRSVALGLATVLLGGVLPLIAPVVSQAQTEETPLAVPARHVEPVVMTGAQLPSWSRLPAEGAGKPYPSGSNQAGGDGIRDAHNGTLNVPPDPRSGVAVDRIAAYRWKGNGFEEIRVQVDERFPYFLANARSNFAFYSGTDKELSYAWDVESWKKQFGECAARYAESVEEVQGAIAAGWMKLGGSTPTDMLGAMADPVPTLDDDDEIAFMASDAGSRAPAGFAPTGTGDERQEIRIADPRDPGTERFVYLFLKDEGSSFDASNGYVDYRRDDAADEWIDRDTYADDDREKVGSSNTVYGPNIPGTVCTEDLQAPHDPTPRATNDRFPRDGVTVSTDTYQWRATGRWMVRNMHITKPGTARQYGPDLIDRWKGRAFQQSPDSSISVVGFEDEQVNWEGNSVLLGELAGPVRAIRETWGADSGTNVTKTETFYRDAVHYRYRVRVHPIPPDGLYTSWDYNNEVASTYFNETRMQGVPVDGVNDEVVGNVDGAGGRPFYFDAPDPTHSKPLANFNWEQVSGKGDAGSLVYMFEMKNPTSVENPLVVPYYRDDACLDDGTGDDPTPRPWPGENSTDSRVYPGLPPCDAGNPETWKPRQGCFGCHGVHYFLTGDTDNATSAQGALTEIDGAQWQWAVPTSEPTNVGDAYANTVKTPLVVSASTQSTDTAAVSTNAVCDPLDPAACLLPFPNDFFTTSDESTDTDRRVNLSPLAMPRNGTDVTEGGEGKPVDPTEWNRNDGFSPGSPALTYVPGLDLHQTWGTQDRPRSDVGPNTPGYFDHRDHIADIGLYRQENAPIVIINEETGERHPFWSELDTHPDAIDAGQQMLILRPAVNFEEDTRYVVALRNLKDSDGSVLPARPEFAAYRGGSGEDSGRQQHYNQNIFPVLESAGIARDDLYLAWDFTVASERNLAGRILHMRDDAFGRVLGDSILEDRAIQGSAPAFTVDATSEFTDTWTDSRGRSFSRRYRRIEGRVTVPNYMDRIQQTESHFKAPGTAPGTSIQYDVPAPGSRLLDVNQDGKPEQNPVEPTINVFFVCEVPLNGKQNLPGLYGHGLLGQGRDQIQDFRRSPGRWGPFFGCAADWWGMATQDLPTVLGTTVDMSLFPTIPDRAQQGFLNFMFLGRAAAHPQGFGSHPAFQQDGNSLVDSSPVGEPTRLYYDGNSQGGIMGGSLVAVSPDISRAILGVPGMNYSTLLNRSVDFEGAEFGLLVYNAYRDPLERQIVFGLMQMLWDRGEANGFAHHITGDPLANTPPHEVMLQVAWSDHQVANVSAEVEARTINAPIMVPGLPTGGHWEMNPYFGPTATYPHNGSALVYWDSGNARPPNGNIPPTHNGDPHGHPRNEPAAGWQEAHFLLTGEMVDVCEGGDYLTRRHPQNGGTGSSPPSCHPPDREPGTEAVQATVAFTDRSADSGQYSDATLFEARLTDAEGDPISGQQLTFELSGESSRSFTAETDGNGIAGVTPTLEEKPGPYQLTVRFDGDDSHAASADTTNFIVAKEDSATEISVQGQGNNQTLRARLSDSDTPSNGIAQRTIDFYSDGELIGSDETDQDGVATLGVPPGHRGANRTYEARFSGDDFYLGSSHTHYGTGDQHCTADNPIDRATISGNVIVPRGESCTLTASTVNGNVTVQEDSSLNANGNTITGNVDGDKAEKIALSDNDISGNVTIKDGETPDGGDVLIEHNTLSNGSLKIEKMSGDIKVTDNTVSKGDVAVLDNSIGDGYELVVNGNTVTNGSLKVLKNTGSGAKSVTGNNGGNDLECKDNADPFTGAPNGSWKTKKDQCAE